MAALALAFFDTGSGAFGRATILSPAAPSAVLSAQRGFSLANVDPTCPACRDFYRYAMGGWETNSPIPPTVSRWSVLEEVRSANRTQLREIIDAISREGWPRGSPEQKVSDFYGSCMDVRARDAAGISPISGYLSSLRDVRDLSDVRIQAAVLQNLGVHALFSSGIEADPRDEQRALAMIGQDGLGLPDRDLYFPADAHALALRDAYQTHVARYFVLAGDDAATAAAAARGVLAVETSLARASRAPSDRRDRLASYHKMTIAEAQVLIPSLDLGAFYRERGALHVETLDVQQPDYVRGVETTLRSATIRDLRSYLRFHLLDRTARVLSTPFSDEAFAFDSVLTGQREQTPLWDRCVRMVDADLGDALGQLYVAKALTPETRARTQRIVETVEGVLREQLATLPWMSEATRREAVAKFDAIATRIGAPERWRTYAAFDVDRGLLAGNVLRAGTYRAQQMFAQLGRPLNHDVWSMTTPTVNASYDAGSNDVTIPAGLLRPPLFSNRYDDAVLYGTIGAIAAHELTHAFDDEGRKSDAHGVLRDWWQPADALAFTTRSTCVAREYSRFTVAPEVHENGRFVLGEAIADLGGAEIAYRALERSLAGKPRPFIDGWTPEQRFFLAFAESHASTDRPERARLAVLVDPHPSGRDRVLGTLKNMPEFAGAFACKAGDAMVVPAAQRCSVW